MQEYEPLDCIAMKGEIQARLAEKWRDLSDDQIRAEISRELESSQEPLAQWWRRADVRQPATTTLGPSDA